MSDELNVINQQISALEKKVLYQSGQKCGEIKNTADPADIELLDRLKGERDCLLEDLEADTQEPSEAPESIEEAPEVAEPAKVATEPATEPAVEADTAKAEYETSVIDGLSFATFDNLGRRLCGTRVVHNVVNGRYISNTIGVYRDE